MWHTVAPNATRSNDEVLERQERWRGKEVLLLFCVCLLACFSLIFFVLFFLGYTAGVKKDMGELIGEQN